MVNFKNCFFLLLKRMCTLIKHTYIHKTALPEVYKLESRLLYLSHRGACDRITNTNGRCTIETQYFFAFSTCIYLRMYTTAVNIIILIGNENNCLCTYDGHTNCLFCQTIKF